MQPNAKILSLRMTSISLGLVETSVSTGTEISPSPILDVIATPTKTKTLHKFWHPASRTACRRIGNLQHPVHRTSRRRRRGDMDTWLQALEMDPQNRIWGWKMETREKKNSGCHVHEPKRLIKLNDTGQYRLIYMDDTFHFLVNIRKSNLAIWSSKDQHFIL